MTKLFRALDDPTRRRMLELLRERELTVGEIGRHFVMSLPSISYHLDLLRQADLVVSEKRGQFVHYALNTSVLDETLAWLTGLMAAGRRSAYETKDMLRSAGPRLVLLAAPFLVLVPLWDKFPARVPIHWGLDGRANGWADKSWGLLLTPVLNVVLTLLLSVLMPLDKRVRSYGPEMQGSLKRVIGIIGLATTCFMTGMALLIDALSLGYKVDVLRVTTLGTLLLLVVLGNYLPKLRPNRFVGIRTPWTLASPEVWNRTHRLFGSILLIGSVGLMVPCAFLPGAWSVFVMMGFLLAVSFGAMAYSYVVRKV